MDAFFANTFKPLIVLSLLFAIVSSTHAYAQSAPTEEQKQTARKHMQAGQAAFEVENFTKAANEFSKAYNIIKHPAFVYNAALAWERASKRENAAATYETYLRIVGADADDADEVRGKIVRLRNLSVTAPETKTSVSRSVLTIISDPPKAKVTIKRKQKVIVTGNTPFSPTLKPGKYSVLLEHDDYLPKSYQVEVKPGVVKEFVFGLAQNELLTRLQVVSNPPGAEVFVDNLKTGLLENKTPLTITLTPGKHIVWIKKVGYQPSKHEVDLTSEDLNKVQAELERVDHGWIRVLGQPRGAQVNIDGENVGAIPWEGKVSTGNHEVTVSSDGRVDWDGSVEVEAGKRTPVEVELAHGSSKVGAWIMTGLTAATLGASIAFALLSESVYTDLNTDIQNDPFSVASTDSRFADGKLFSIIADVGFAVTGAFAITSLLLFLLGGSSEKSRAKVRKPRDIAFAPILSPTFSGGVVQWTF